MSKELGRMEELHSQEVQKQKQLALRHTVAIKEMTWQQSEEFKGTFPDVG